MNDVTRRLAFERLVAAHPTALVTDLYLAAPLGEVSRASGAARP